MKHNKKEKTGLLDLYFSNYFTSIIVPFAILFIVIISIGIAYIVNYENTFTEDAKQQCANLLDTELTTSTNIYASLSSNETVNKFLSSSFSYYDEFEIADVYNNINSYITMFLLDNPGIDSIGIFSEINKSFILNSENTRDYSYVNSSLYKNFEKNKGKQGFWSEYSYVSRNIPVISLYNTIYTDNTPTGFIVINLNLLKLRQEYSKIINTDCYNVVIANNNNNNNNILFSLFDEQTEFSYDDLIKHKITAPSPWDLFAAFYVSKNPLPARLTVYILSIFFVILIVMVFIMRVSHKLAQEAYTPIEDTLKYIQDFGIENVPNELSEYDEVNLIFENLYNQKLEYTSLKAQFEQAAMQINSLRETVLEAQIKPHFLFNTLEVINLEAYSLFGGNNLVSKMIVALSGLLKLSFKKTGKFIKVSEEIEHVKQYIYLQSIKYENCFETKWDIDESILDCSTTKLILQPIAENAITHGVVPSRRFCTISVKAYGKDDNIFFEISDNGVGIDSEKLLNLQKQLSDASIHYASGIGLDNVNQRIKIIYGSNYGCMVDCKDGLTTVTIKIPAKTQ